MAASEAPFLREYFEKTKTWQADTLAWMQTASATNPEWQAELKTKQATYWEEMKLLLQQAFKHHDTKNTNVLDKEEAAVLFSHLVAEEEPFLQAMAAVGLQGVVPMILSQLEAQVEPEQRPALQAQADAYIKQAVGETEGKIANALAEYKEKKVEMDQALFKVMDTSGDGSIQLEEFIACFEVGSGMNMQMREAIGLGQDQLSPAEPDCQTQ